MFGRKEGLMKLAFVLFICVAGTARINAQPVSFPGAEGYGRFVTGGRGTVIDGRKIFLDAQVVEVTSLEDYNEGEAPVVGSFRWALAQQDTTINGTTKMKIPTTIVFRVGGVIQLKRDIHMAAKNLTIAGQTAPGDGICFSGATLNFSGSENIIVRYIRSRPGDIMNAEVSAFRIENGKDFIIDHCSFSWAIEETTHFSSNDNTTVQWCIISESLYNSIHKKGSRGYGTQWGGEYASYHHNLLAHHNSRMPRINGSNPNDIYALVDYRNNVNYNWGSSGAFYGGEWEGTNGKGFCHTNVVNNYFKKGPATSGNNFAAPSKNRDGVQFDGYAKWYFNGNVMEGDEALTNDNWLGVSTGSVGGKDNIYSDTEFVQTDGVLEQYANYTQTAEEAYGSVIQEVGASFPVRDAHDERLIKELTGEIQIVRFEYTTGEGQQTPTLGVGKGLIDTQNNLVSPEDRDSGVTAWDVYSETTEDEAPVDTDHDGMPDEWETANGLNPQDGTDFRIITPSGYIYLEAYLAELVGDSIDLNTSGQDVERYLKTDEYLTIFPNPVSEEFTIETNAGINYILIFDLSGHLIQSESIDRSGKTINVSGLNGGCYLIKALTKENNWIVSKMIKM